MWSVGVCDGEATRLDRAERLERALQICDARRHRDECRLLSPEREVDAPPSRRLNVRALASDLLRLEHGLGVLCRVLPRRTHHLGAIIAPETRVAVAAVDPICIPRVIQVEEVVAVS